MRINLTHFIHGGFYCTRRHAAPTGLTVGGLTAQSVNILFKYASPPSRLRAPVSLGVSTVSSRTLVNNAGYAVLDLTGFPPVDNLGTPA